MTNGTIPALYGRNDEDDETADTVKLSEVKEVAIKSNGRNFVTIKSGSDMLDVPSAKYVKELEDQVMALDRIAKKNRTENRRLQLALNDVIRDLNSLRKELKNKVDKF
jgi:hypothetical protein